MQIDTWKLAQGTAVIGLGAVLNLIPVQGRIAAVATIGIEIAIALIESVKKAECGVTTEEEDDLEH